MSKFFFNGTLVEFEPPQDHKSSWAKGYVGKRITNTARLRVALKTSNKGDSKTKEIEITCPESILRFLNEHHLEIDYDKDLKLWGITDNNSKNGTWVSHLGSNWVRLTPKKTYYSRPGESVFALSKPLKDKALYFGEVSEDKFSDRFKRLIDIGKNNPSARKKIRSMLSALKKAQVDFKHEKWNSLFWWTAKEEEDLKEIDKLIDSFSEDRISGTEEVSVAIKKILYAHSQHDIPILGTMKPLDLMEAMDHLLDNLENKYDYVPPKSMEEYRPAAPLMFSRELFKREIAEAINEALRMPEDQPDKKIGIEEIYNKLYSNYKNPPDRSYPKDKEKIAVEYLKQYCSSHDGCNHKEGDSGSWDVFYFHLHAKNRNSKHRFYLNINLKRQDEFFKLLVEKVIMNLVPRNVYVNFKFSKGGPDPDRLDRVVLYCPEDISRIISSFFANHQDLFNNEKLIFTIPICKGISYAPEKVISKKVGGRHGSDFIGLKGVLNQKLIIAAAPSDRNVDHKDCFKDIRVNGREPTILFDSRPPIFGLKYHLFEVDNHSIVYFSGSMQSWKIEIKDNKFRFSFDGETFEDLWFEKTSSGGLIQEGSSPCFKFESWGTEMEHIIRLMWESNKDKTPQQIADLVMDYMKRTYIEEQFKNL